MKRLSPMDAIFLYLERPETPMHAAGLLVFDYPEGADAGFCRELIDELRSATRFERPWSQRLRSPRLKRLSHFWVDDPAIDLEYHVRHSALPEPGGERELGQLIARLHSYPLDLTRPPWEVHVIEGLEGNRFAMYFKLHHALTDGVSALRMLLSSLSEEADDLDHPLFWMKPAPSRTRGRKSDRTGIRRFTEAMRGNMQSVPDIARAFGRLIPRQANELALPFTAPPSLLNARVSGQRRFATQQYETDRVKRLAKTAECSLNDVVLALSAAALRRFLEESGALPKKSLTVGIPVSVRAKDDEGAGNAISMMVSTLATEVADPVERLRAISASVGEAKEHFRKMSPEALQSYTVLFLTPYILQMATGAGSAKKPIWNVVVSNVPGPNEPRYLRGARLNALYPISLAFHGQALNITCVSYAGTLNFGFTAARDSLPHMQRIAVYMGEALEELEQALLKKPKSRGTTSRRK